MNKTDKISRATKIITDSVKDTVSRNILLSTKSKSLRIEESQLHNLMQIIDVSMSEGYQIALRSFQKNIDKILLEDEEK